MEYLYLFLILVVVFWKALLCGYCVDDDVRVRQFKDDWRAKKWEGLNWIERLDRCIYGAGFFKTPFQEHMFTSLYHYANTCLVYYVTGSFTVAVLFLVNPVNNQVSIWLNGRRYAIAITLILLAFKFNLISLPLFLVAAWVHVSAVPFIILMAFQPWGLLMVALGLIGFFAFGGYAKIKSRFLSRKADFTKNNECQRLTWKKSIIYVKSLGFYFFHTIFPNKPRMYHKFLYYFSRNKEGNEEGYSFNFEFYKGLAVVLFVGYEMIFQHNIWALWWLVFVTPWSNIIQVTQPVADRYCTLSGIGLMVILVKYVEMLPSPYKECTYTAIILFYFLRYAPLFDAYKSQEYFHNYHIALQPDAVESRSLKATRYLRVKDPMTAFAIIKEGLRFRPNDFKLLLIMAQSLFYMGKHQSALKVLDLAEKQVPLGEEEEAKKELGAMRGSIETMHKMSQPPPMNRAQRRRAGK